MSRWFRFYADAHRNPKVAKLSDKDFRLWVELLSVAAEKDGFIPCLSDLKHILKRRLDHLSSAVERLISVGLIEQLGERYVPHGWDKRQYKSDVSTDRVRKSRAKCNVSETPPETDTETDTETEYSVSKDTGASADPEKLFWDNATAYLGPKSRGMIGRWIKDYTRPRVAEAIAAAQVERAVDPIPYIAATLRRKGRRGSDDEMTMPC
jgi:hypothetical protein